MKCIFTTNGLAFSYDHKVKPCCVFKRDTWEHTIDNTDLTTWFSSPAMTKIRDQLDKDIWPSQCSSCKFQESQGRGDSVRLNGESSYNHYTNDDLTLEIRPGNTCNFACQTCWPSASSRVSSYHKQAFGTKDVVSKRYDDFSFLDPVKHRLKDIVLLGGEPFYDKSCLNFLSWLKNSDTDANLTMFTNGSVLDWDFINNYKGKLTISVSLDAVGKIAEYVRPGTEWETVSENYARLKKTPHINTRVNITPSVYNFPFLSDLVEWLAQDWPEIVSIGIVSQPYLRECVVPKDCRTQIIDNLLNTVNVVKNSNIIEHQKQNTIGALMSIANNLQTEEFDNHLHEQFLQHMTKLDLVKNLYGIDYSGYYEDIKKT